MCMQDLAISSRVTWRKMATPETRPDGYMVIPQSPLRVALSIFSPATSGGAPIRLAPSATSPIINQMVIFGIGQSYIQSTVNVHDYPGLFNGDLFLQDAPGDGGMWEAVMDSDLSKSVQRANDSITQEVR